MSFKEPKQQLCKARQKKSSKFLNTIYSKAKFLTDSSVSRSGYRDVGLPLLTIFFIIIIILSPVPPLFNICEIFCLTVTCVSHAACNTKQQKEQRRLLPICISFPKPQPSCQLKFFLNLKKTKHPNNQKNNQTNRAIKNLMRLQEDNFSPMADPGEKK